MADPTNDPDLGAGPSTLANLSPEAERELFGRFLAALAGPGSPPIPLLRAERVEVVDAHGRARIVLGELGGPDADTLGVGVGVGVYDRRGSERITLALGDAGPLVGFSLGGNDALILGVDDPETTATRPGPYLELLGPDGHVAMGWRVDGASGELTVEGIERLLSMLDVWEPEG